MHRAFYRTGAVVAAGLALLMFLRETGAGEPGRTGTVTIVSDQVVARGFRAEQETPDGVPLSSPGERYLLLPTRWDGDGTGHVDARGHLVDRERGVEVAHLFGRGEVLFIDRGKRLVYWYWNRSGDRGLWTLDLEARRPRQRLVPLDRLGNPHYPYLFQGKEARNSAIRQDPPSRPLLPMVKSGYQVEYARHLRARRVYPHSDRAEEIGEFRGEGLSWNAATGEIACWRDGTSDNGGVYAIRLRDGRIRRIHRSGHAPAWSPDGRQIAFHDRARLARPEKVIVAEASGNRQRIVTSGRLVGWTRDGRKLAVWQDIAGSPPGSRPIARIILQDIRTPASRVLHTLSAQEAEGLQWSPSRAWLATRVEGAVLFLSTHDGTRYELPIANAAWFQWGARDDELFYQLDTEWHHLCYRLPTPPRP